MENTQLGKRLNENIEDEQPINKRQKVMEESFELKNLPSAQAYEKSYMHKDTVTFICVSQKMDFIITASNDGYVKFWRKVVQGIEFVKTYRAHL